MVLEVWEELGVARFLCRACGGTISCLPSFCLSYRHVAVETVEAAFLGHMDEPGVQKNRDLLSEYFEKWESRAAEIERVTGNFFGPIGEPPPSDRLLKAMLQPWKTLAEASVQLLEHFGEALLGCYRIHDWARMPRGSVDPRRKPAIQDSS